MKVEIDKYMHEVIYIEYQDMIPWSVITMIFVSTAKEPYWRCYYWDVFAESGNKNDLRIYNSGSGGNPLKIEAPKYMDGVTGCEYWISNKASLKEDGKNITKIEKPRRIIYGFNQSSINPFKTAEQTYSNEYCDVCGYHSVDFCFEHKFDDENGEARYKHDNSYCD